MINPDEIKRQALKWWNHFLQSQVTNQEFFPKTIDRIGKIQSSQVLSDFVTVQNQLTELYKQSKEKLGYGYLVKTTSKNFRRTGSHELPDFVEFNSAEDFVKYIGKAREWQVFLKNKKVVLDIMPILKDWIISNPEQLTTNDKAWADLLKVCQYFLSNPRPEMYIRQLPVEIHTKFIEENETILKSLLDYLIPNHIRNVSAKAFAVRYYLRYDEPLLVRLRILDESLSINGLTDLLIKVSDFENLDFPCKNIVLTENKMNFLTLPNLPETLAIWSGGGFNIAYLKGVEWMQQRQIYYWGDLDIQGFHILHQMRSYYPQTRSIMMDTQTLTRFRDSLAEGQPGAMINLDLLENEERELFSFLKEKNLRLEQEKIDQNYSDTVFNNLFNC